ncbi:MAG: hypothetical protein APF81_27400 [Desulfosporosinus sp. BRH_c37]|nr:MAG: hypothetical protein APF81_27400 [Desulfosporosinus sp. BRH_c37]
MKIRVSYSELVSGPGFNNRRAEAELEVTVENKADIEGTYKKAWERVKSEVKRQLTISNDNDEVPF